MVIYILGGLVALCIIATPVFGYVDGEKKISDIISNAGFGLLSVVPALLVLTVIGFGNLVAGDYGPTSEKSRETYKLAPNSEVKNNGSYAEFIYTDAAGTAQSADKRVDVVTTTTNGKGDTVEYVVTHREQGTWLFPWGNSTITRELIVK